MAKYMTQKMVSGVKKAITYYRRQSAHPTHVESGKFTADAIADYAKANSVAQSQVEKGPYSSGQGIPTAGTTKEI